MKRAWIGSVLVGIGFLGCGGKPSLDVAALGTSGLAYGAGMYNPGVSPSARRNTMASSTAVRTRFALMSNVFIARSPISSRATWIPILQQVRASLLPNSISDYPRSPFARLSVSRPGTWSVDQESSRRDMVYESPAKKGTTTERMRSWLSKRSTPSASAHRDTPSTASAREHSPRNTKCPSPWSRTIRPEFGSFEA
jgi:hypothetical protein